MKKVLFCLFGSAVICGALTFAACGIFGGKEEEIPEAVTVDVYSVSDFSNVTEDAETPLNVVLHNDIDVENLTFSTVLANGKYENTLQGNGYTIKNVLLLGASTGMFENFTEISDLTVDTIQANLTTVSDFGVIGGSVTTVKNCTVTNLTATISGLGDVGRVGAVTGNSATIENCTAENIEINVTGGQKLIVGGVAGRCYTGISDCSASDVSISVKLTVNGGYDYIGGVAGILASESTGENITSKNITLYHYCVVEKYWGAVAYAGGVFGTVSGTLVKAFSDGVTISGTDSEYYLAGGITGRVFSGAQITNSAAVNLSFNINNNNADGRAEAGGIVGRLNGTLMSCYSYNAKFSGKGGIYIYVGGIVGNLEDGVLTYCASFNEKSGSLDSYRTYTGSSSNSVHHSQIAGYSTGSIANCYYINSTSVEFTHTVGSPQSVTSDEYTAEFYTNTLKFIQSYWDFSQFEDVDVVFPLPAIK